MKVAIDLPDWVVRYLKQQGAEDGQLALHATHIVAGWVRAQLLEEIKKEEIEKAQSRVKRRLNALSILGTVPEQGNASTDDDSPDGNGASAAELERTD